MPQPGGDGEQDDAHELRRRQAEYEAIALGTNELDEESLDAVEGEERGEELPAAEPALRAEAPEDREHDARQSHLVELGGMHGDYRAVGDVCRNRVAEAAQISRGARRCGADGELHADGALGIAAVVIA